MGSAEKKIDCDRVNHLYKAGIFGMLTFGACGFHGPCLAVCYVYNAVINAIDAGAVNLSFLWMFSGLLISGKAIKK